jgi:hypothetical protein
VSAAVRLIVLVPRLSLVMKHNVKKASRQRLRLSVLRLQNGALRAHFATNDCHAIIPLEKPDEEYLRPPRPAGNRD